MEEGDAEGGGCGASCVRVRARMQRLQWGYRQHCEKDDWC